jgi:hypothetical protein
MRTPRATPKETSRAIIAAWVHGSTTAGFARMIEPPPAWKPRQQGHDTRAIQGWHGHRAITSTAVYTALAPNRFKDFWRD